MEIDIPKRPPHRAAKEEIAAELDHIEPRWRLGREIQPTYRVITDTVCAPPSSVGRAGIEPATLGLRVPCSTS
jgi:hypothetical protein